MEIPAFLILNKSRLRYAEMHKIREHCKNNNAISLHENNYNMCVHLLDESELSFHLYVYDLLYKTAERR